MLDAPMFAARWRWNASRALAILRFRGGRKVPPPIQRMRSDDLLASVFPDQVACAENLTGEIRIPDHPLVNETIDNCLHEAMDIDGLKRDPGRLRIRTRSAKSRSTPPSRRRSRHEILNANPYAYLDDAPLEERRARAVQLRRTLRTRFRRRRGHSRSGGHCAGRRGILAGGARCRRTARRAAHADHAAAASRNGRRFSKSLGATGRARVVERGGKAFWIATERLRAARRSAAGGARLDGIARPGHGRTLLAETLAFPRDEVESRLLQLEAEGQVMRGRFRRRLRPDEMEWCNRRILARIHRLTLGQLRREIEPVTAAQFQRFLYRWQHLVPGSRLHGVDGTLQIVKQLQGYEISAAAWEPEVLARRIAHYEPEFLDQLCLAGEVMWARLVAASGVRGSGAAARASHAHRADRDLPARERRLAGTPRRILDAQRPFFRTPPAKCLTHSSSAAHRSSPIWCAPPAAWPAKWRTGCGNWWPRAW